MTERPPQLPIRAVAPVVKAARRLSGAQKLVWLELLELDQGGPNGAWLGAGGLAERLGYDGREAVEEHRRHLCGLGLLMMRKIPGRRTASWYPILPSECVPEGRDRPDVDVITRCARALDDYILARLNGVARYASLASRSNAEPAYSSTPVGPEVASRSTPVANDSTEEPACQSTPVPSVLSQGMACSSTPRLACSTTPRSRERSGEGSGERGEAPISPASASVHSTGFAPDSRGEGAGEGGGRSYANGDEAGEAGARQSDRQLTHIAQTLAGLDPPEQLRRCEAELERETDPKARRLLERWRGQLHRSMEAQAS